MWITLLTALSKLDSLITWWIPQQGCSQAILLHLYLCWMWLHPGCRIWHFNPLNHSQMLNSTKYPILQGSRCMMSKLADGASKSCIKISDKYMEQNWPRSESWGTLLVTVASHLLQHFELCTSPVFTQHTMNTLIPHLDNFSRRILWRTSIKSLIKTQKNYIHHLPFIFYMGDLTGYQFS